MATPFDGLTNKKPLGFAKRAQLDADRQLLSGRVGRSWIARQKAKFQWSFLTKGAQKAASAIAHFSAGGMRVRNPV